MPHHTPWIDVLHFGFLINHARLARPCMIYQEDFPWGFDAAGKKRGRGIKGRR